MTPKPTKDFQQYEIPKETKQAIIEALNKKRCILPPEYEAGLLDAVRSIVVCHQVEIFSSIPADEKAVAKQQIKRLQKALEGLGKTAKRILCYEGEQHFLEMILPNGIHDAYRDALQSEDQLARKLGYQKGKCEPLLRDSILLFALDRLGKYCELAQKNTPYPVSYSDGKVELVWEEHDRRAHRHADERKLERVRDFGAVYLDYTGRRPTESKDGPFDRFLNVVLPLIYSEHNTETDNAKLIKDAFSKYGAKYTPKLLQNKLVQGE